MNWKQININRELVDSGRSGEMLSEFAQLREANTSLAFFHYHGDPFKLLFPPIDDPQVSKFLKKYEAVEVAKPSAESVYVAFGGIAAEAYLKD